MGVSEKIRLACKEIKDSKNTLVLTGAGISTESGIPDFRSKGSGIWEKIDPMEALSSLVLFDNPQKFYKKGYNILLEMTDVEPNEGHIVLAEMERLKFVEAIITQNIDNLHHKAGSKKVFEVHGNTRTGTCLECDNKVSLEVLSTKVKKGEIPPKCNQCGGTLRPDVVLFGDKLPEDFNKAWELVQDCDLLIVIGSSLNVAPVSFLPQMAPKTILINLGKTPFDSYSDIVINQKASIVLKEILKELRKGE